MEFPRFSRIIIMFSVNENLSKAIKREISGRFKRLAASPIFDTWIISVFKSFGFGSLYSLVYK
ncbi:hypothetical protein AtNW77_Chr2g0269261 [Arabidopsis thaliana]|uniref:Transmembrane protein n=3 Tax=Arabidopsis TaxID=3701 RepID=A0A654F3P7_ARATH|nr:uncharacterized protein AT2G46308 [Arabidopsis thaliana]AEC10674.1 transmembrane protein [Arabidopsis thaliana]KAG7639906.1 hypothetical protein ISN45_At02g041660 [Arabidopsis thaliana x Arabidopsis arenosa]CAA0377249.1 unnamed protein product [Arabidopsis thaliana]VYS55698.1 unnamed protein product [Arabidopsis thaliana]|eukprot:NP_001118535.1 transmembrane protein [Arabidopsis thaliana]